MNFADLHEDSSTFSYRYHDDTDIHEFSFRAVTTVEVDKWIDITQRMKPAVVAHGLHLRSLYHMHGVTPSAYAIRSAMQTIRQLPKTLPMSTVLLLDETSIATILAQMFLRQLPVRALQSRQIFFREEEALRWLEERRTTIEQVRMG